MKRLYSILVLIILTVALFGQVPAGFKYQAVLRDASGNVRADVDVSIAVIILQGSATGTQVYSETHGVTTNEFGLVNLEIGTKNASGFAVINWADGPYFLKVIVDGIELGTSQLLSVPYAFHARTAENVFSGDYNDLLNKPFLSVSEYGDTLYLSMSNYVIIPGISNANYSDTNTISDIQGNIYETSRIGNQIWMAQNLAYLPSVGPPTNESTTSPFYYVYDYNGSNVNEARLTNNYNTYGVLYNWPAAMAGETSSNSNPGKVQGVCPSGWHIPSELEWIELTEYLGGIGIAGGKLKEVGTSHWDPPNTGTDEYDYSALPAGIRHGGNVFMELGTGTAWWSSTENEADYARARSIGNAHGNELVPFHDYKGNGFSIRCIKD